MEHVRQTQMIRLVAGELADDERAAVERHLAGCGACRAAYESQARTWSVLGEWALPDTPRNLFAGIERKLASRAVAPRPRWAALRSIGRIAAAVLIGVGVGYATGKARAPAPPEAPAVVSPAAESEALRVLGLDHVANPSPAGLYGTLLHLDAETAVEEGQS